MTEPGATVPRLVPELPLPPYTFVPGRHPHPTADPEGHSYGAPHEPPAPVDPDNWPASRPYLFGIDLFNHGYYWEAHEVWEGLWHACGRSGTTADFLKGLIQMTAAGVKVRQGMPRGVASLGAGAAELFQKVLDALGPGKTRHLGLDLRELLPFVRGLAADPGRWAAPPDGPVAPVLPLVLRPREETSGER
jgi:predicted metal-dependent hydrolase